LKVADAVAELNPVDDLWQAVPDVEFAPFLLRRRLPGRAVRSNVRRRIISLKAIASPVLRLRQPLVRFVRCRTVAKVLSIGFDVRTRFQCSAEKS